MQNRKSTESYSQIAYEIIGDRLRGVDEDVAVNIRSDVINIVASLRRGLGCGALSSEICVTCQSLELEQPICQTVDVPDNLPTFVDYGRAFY